MPGDRPPKLRLNLDKLPTDEALRICTADILASMGLDMSVFESCPSSEDTSAPDEPKHTEP